MREFLRFIIAFRPDQFIDCINAYFSEGNGLVALLWSTDKMKAINSITAQMKKRNYPGICWSA